MSATISAYRIVKPRWSEIAFSGEGARLYGGRWNSPGTPMVYLAGSRSLAVLEMMAHCSIAALRMKYAVIEVRFDRRLAKELSEEGLPANWQSDPAPSSTHRIGDEWVRDGRSLALSVPSSIVPQERNFLLNPSHAHFAKMSFGEPRAFQFDSRLLG